MPAWLDRRHPNFERWERSRQLSEDRGRFAVSVIGRHLKCENLNILDLGSGEGGTSAVLCGGNFVVSTDISIDRLKRQKGKNRACDLVEADAVSLPFKHDFFDMVILQDVIEHVTSPQTLISNVYNILKPGGAVYLSTPNKLSPFNMIADPHWGMPFVSILKRDTIKKYFLKYFRKSEYDRRDAAQLLSYSEIAGLAEGKFSLRLNTKHSVKRLFGGDKGIVWSEFHLSVIKTLKKIHLDKLILKTANDRAGFINKYLNPTFYLILKKNLTPTPPLAKGRD